MPTVRTNDIETYYERRGTGPTVVFVHGAVLDHSQWAPQVAALRDAYDCIAYDVRGHGRTGGSVRGAYSVDLFAEDLVALLTALDIERPVLCGLSTGGCIAQTVAARHPDRLSGLVLADTFTPEVRGWAERLQRVYGLRATIPLVRLFGYERVERVMVGLQERFNAPGAGGEYDRIEALREARPRMTTAEFAKVVRAVAAFEETDLDLAAITVPTLVLYGENEVGFVKRHAATLAATLPTVEVESIPNAGHASNLDNPERFTGALRAFLDARTAGAG